ncbi:thiamine biosynthesis protein ApbE [Paralimibaculum aggregatum]|uniref:Thiamine biosynthesis protein ApbE n=1 Tax=Paralimibaculum aggregatum TaxID=3036245 RepID=A0ABQ6LLP4_9RHOB|nr:UPF0280 family protein [Limibaculum sp. NKW23]GMG84121.1 thiamine biosynthesis protein ApbE [Limibaculum sp. NKW23]
MSAAGAVSGGWREGPVATLTPDGTRPRLMHGPIDLILLAEGPEISVRMAHRRAWERFRTILEELVAELPALRAPAHPGGPAMRGAVARRMAAATAPHAAAGFVTPMAAVAGAVADEVLGAMATVAGLTRVAVNNGGDIALMLAPGTGFRAAMADMRGPGLGAVEIAAAQLPPHGRGGIATSGWRGRSHSLGIADAVTVVARSAAAADAAATLIANAVDLPGHPAIRREPAAALAPDSDLGDRAVVTAVGPLAPADRQAALAAGLARAEAMAGAGLIHAASLHLGGDAVETTPAPALPGGANEPES